MRLVHRKSGLADIFASRCGIPISAKGWLTARRLLAREAGLAAGGLWPGEALPVCSLAAKALLVIETVKCPELLLPAGGRLATKILLLVIKGVERAEVLPVAEALIEALLAETGFKALLAKTLLEALLAETGFKVLLAEIWLETLLVAKALIEAG